MRRLALAVLAALALPAAASAQQAMPIPGPLDGPLPLFQGAAATAQPLRGPWNAQNPALAADGRSGTGLAAGNGAASPLPGPLGKGTTRASAFMAGTCGGLGLGPRDRVVAVCTGPLGPTLRLVDPRSLATLSSVSLGARNGVDMNDVSGGTHFLVRDDGTLLIPKGDGSLLTIKADGDTLRPTGSVSLTKVFTAGERPFAVAAGFDGRDWAVGTNGTVVTLGRGAVGPPRALQLRETVAEDLATDPSGTYLVTTRALYRLQATADGRPHVVWRLPIPPAGADSHAGRTHDGPGAAPAIVPGGYVATTDATNPPRLLVARIGGGDAGRLRCAVPLFRGIPGSVEADLVVAGRSVVATNAYGYDNLMTTEGGRTTTGGITRVVVGKEGCSTAWTTKDVSPSADPVVSRATGLLYTLLKPKGFPDDWRLGAIDWRTGALRFSVLAGEGLGFNSSGGPLLLGPDGTAYAGTFGGLVRFRDAG